MVLLVLCGVCAEETYSENHVCCVTNQGEVGIYSIPHLKPPGGLPHAESGEQDGHRLAPLQPPRGGLLPPVAVGV